MNTKSKYLQLAILLCCSLLHVSCEYDTIADAPYPNSLIYLPIAVDGSTSPGGIYIIEDGASTSWISPTPGQPLRYNVEKDANRFIIPLGVYRSGSGNKLVAETDVMLEFDTDTVTRLIASGKLPNTTTVLPLDKLQMPSSASIAAGENSTPFNIIADLAFLHEDAPKRYAIGIRISSSNGEVNPTLSTGIVVIDTRITVPVAKFTIQPSGSSTDTFDFSNKSLYYDFFSGAQAFTWDFGDGSPTSDKVNPQHKYAAPGIYTITLHVKGITGDEVSATEQIEVK